MTKHGRLKPTASNTAIGRQYYQPNGMLHLERRCVYPSAGGVHSKWPDEVHACRMRRANVTPPVLCGGICCVLVRQQTGSGVVNKSYPLPPQKAYAQG